MKKSIVLVAIVAVVLGAAVGVANYNAGTAEDAVPYTADHITTLERAAAYNVAAADNRNNFKLRVRVSLLQRAIRLNKQADTEQEDLLYANM
jgi:hypothetical protein